MKKMFYVVFILIAIVLVFAGCLNISNEILPDSDPTSEPVGGEEYSTAIAEVMDIPVTDASGEAVTDAAGEVLTTSVLVVPQDVMVTDADGLAVPGANGEAATTRVYKDASTGNIVSGGEVHTTQVYVDGNGAVHYEKPTQNVTPVQPSTQNDQPSTQPSVQPTQPVGSLVNEFDYLKSGSFYIKGTMSDSAGDSQPLEMAVTPNSLYMLSDFDGASMGMLMNNGKTYMVYEDKQAYLELNSAILKYMGMDSDDMDFSDLDYGQYDLSKANSVISETINGIPCTGYVFNAQTGGSTRFYMNGNKLVRFGAYSASGTPESINDVSLITGTVPPEKILPPTSYTAYSGITGLFSFMGLFGDIMS